MSIEMRHALLSCFVDAFASKLGSAPNYATLAGYSSEHGPVEITVRRAGGKSPAVLAAEYRARLVEMGVTDLAPLPEQAPHQPDPVHEGHLWCNPAKQVLECHGCGGTVPSPNETTAQKWGELMAAFAAVHRKCGEKKEEVER